MILGTSTVGSPMTLDLDRLLETRLLIEANAGGGKSWAIRKLLEETHGHVQHIVLDIEGEFSTLREKYDYVLAGKDADIPAHPKTADLLARKILELNASIIIDLYDLKQHDRIRFVKNFLDAMTNAPKKLWHPALVVIDEAHIFVPERGKADSMPAVIDLATRGRKRGYCAILATQRLSKLHKDAAAECINKMIGRTGLDIDMRRAGDELGMVGKRDILSLRDLDPGEFFVFGPAFTKRVTKIRFGQVKTTHPRAGQRIGEYKPVASKTIQPILSKLIDLPQEAEKELHSKEDMQRHIRHLERELIRKPKPEVDQSTIDKLVQAAVKKASKSLEIECQKILANADCNVKEIFKSSFMALSDAFDNPSPGKAIATLATPRSRTSPVLDNPAALEVKTEGRSFNRCARAILQFLSMRENTAFNKVQIGAMTGYSHGSGGFNNALSMLSQAGLIIRQGTAIQINAQAISDVMEVLGDDYQAPGQHSMEDWLSKLGKCARSIYSYLLETPGTFTKQELGEATGYSSVSGGFNNALSSLNTLGLIQRNPDRTIQINQDIVGL